jgi:hypothetical protein
MIQLMVILSQLILPHVSARTGIVCTVLRPVWEFAVHSGCTVKSVLALVWLSPTPMMAILEMPAGEAPMEVKLQWIRVPGV